MKNRITVSWYHRILAVTVTAAVSGAIGVAQTSTPSVTAPPPGSLTNVTKKIVAKGKGFEITREELDDEVIRLKADLARLGRTIPEGQDMLIDRTVLENLIQLKMLWAKATTNELENARKVAAERIEAEKKDAGDEETFQRRLKAAGLTELQFSNRIVELTVAELVLERLLGVKVTDDDVKKFYNDNPDQFEKPESVRIAHILLLTRDPATGAELSESEKEAKLKKAQGALNRIKNGEDFGKVAKEVSEDPGTRDQGGVISNAIPKGQLASGLPEFEAVVFKLGTNEVSDVITTRLGYHIVKVLEKEPAKMVELEKVSDDIKRYLRRRQIQAGAAKLFEDLKKELEVQIVDEKLKEVKLPEVPSSGG